MEKFLIDRAQGVNIWIDVHKGKVKNCYNESERFNARMNELYKGKSISFLREDFEARFKGVYCNVRPEAILHRFQIVNAIKMRISDCNGKISILQRTTYHNPENEKKANDEMKILRGRRSDLKTDYETHSALLQNEKDRIAKEHDFHMERVLV